ncbi:MAG: hypothetical protein P4L35_04570 [Ignavibacteriaceae bacterium]|nr:hypothetical protein [Ignavibacteriaceae bacterium]
MIKISRFLFYASLFICMISSFSLSQQSDVKLKRLTTDADLIVTGKVSGNKSNWNNDKTRIYTIATLDVDEYLKGNSSGSTVAITYPGGEVNGIGELYTHMPKFENNEDVLVFLKKDDKSYKVFDGEEGKIKIIRDEKTGEKITSSNVRIEDLKTQIKKYLTK